MRIVYWTTYILLIVGISKAANNFTQCLLDVRSGAFGLEGALDNYGKQVANTQDATAISYSLCLKACGKDTTRFNWSLFLQRIGAWLFPWFALASQLPYGSSNNFDNLQSLLLYIGSPALAAYSLVLTVLNRRWLTQRFLPMHEHSNAYSIVRVLSDLQQVPLRINSNAGPNQLLNLVRSPEKEEWWAELKTWFAMTHTWSLSEAISIGWVVIAYVLTISDSLASEMILGSHSGHAIGDLWLWLLPIVVGFMQISPKGEERLKNAINCANERAFGPTEGPDAKSLALPIYPLWEESPVQRDQSRTPPIFNYSRLFTWCQTAEGIARVLSIPTSTAEPPPSTTSSSNSIRTTSAPTPLDDDLRKITEVSSSQEGKETPGEHYDPEAECVQNVDCWGPGVWDRMFVSGCLALFLQWGTTSAAVVSIWFTPTIGLGCRGMSYLIYGGLSTISWFMITISSILAHYATFRKPDPPQRVNQIHVTGHLAIVLRRTGKVIAAINAVCLVTIAILNFGGVYTTCYCNSVVIAFGTGRAFNTIQLRDHALKVIEKQAWIGADIMAASTGLFFLLFVNLAIHPYFPRQIVK